MFSGFGQDPGTMVNTDAVIGEAASSTATPYRLGSYSRSGVVPIAVCAMYIWQ